MVEHYIKRARAFNGPSSMLVTEDGRPVAKAIGTVRAGAPLNFPTQTLKASELLPDLGKYKGPPLEYGRMEATASDPSVQQQFGMVAGIPNAGQVNALATLNIRGERSVSCKGDFDRAPSAGPLPAGAPAGCEAFRKQPDALERARELDAQYGRNPDLTALPMYCVPFSHKNWYDATSQAFAVFLPVKSVGDKIVYIRDIANVRDGNPPQSNIVRVEGNRAALMSVMKDPVRAKAAGLTAKPEVATCTASGSGLAGSSCSSAASQAQSPAAVAGAPIPAGTVVDLAEHPNIIDRKSVV